AAEKDRLHRASRRLAREVGELAGIGLDISRLVELAAMDMRIEVAIGALGGAKGPVHVNAEQAVRTRIDGIVAQRLSGHELISPLDPPPWNGEGGPPKAVEGATGNAGGGGRPLHQLR